MTSVLIVDDEQVFLDSVARRLRTKGYRDITTVRDPTTVLSLTVDHAFDVAFLDISMPKMDGITLLELIKQESPSTECVMVTAHESVPLAVKAIRLGAFDYLVKPVDPNQLVLCLTRAVERRRMVDMLEVRTRPIESTPLSDPEAFEAIITNDEAMLRLLHEAELHAKSTIPVLITGETGVGKELLARAIHDTSSRAKGPFIPINMLSLSASLFESELFGHAKGAFTGAVADRDGYLKQAKGGTLFLDEIGDLGVEIQGKLLRILQEEEYTPVGKTRPEKADVRFIAATNLDLAKQVRAGRFRKDLYYRLRFAGLHLPPLRERRGDIRALAAHFVAQSTRPRATLSDEAATALVRHDWPGNVRELRGAVLAAANLAERCEIDRAHLNLPSDEITDTPPGQPADADALLPMAEVERRHILRAYETLEHNKTQTARALGISLASLHRKLKAYSVD
jgi:DNA-binding NtrC family response regulator